MAEVLGVSETVVRFGSFAAVFAVMAIAEAARPRRVRNFPRSRRWVTNLGIVALDSLFIRLLFPLVAVGAAEIASARSIGLLNQIDLPPLVEGLIAVVLLDMAIYWQHVIFHKVPVLWRLHMVHHADPDFDVTTALRFHPIEIGLSMLLKIALVFLIGPSAVAVVVFEVVLNGMAMFNHANARLPAGLDRVLRLVVVTPDMHRVHHSTIQPETDSNYGFNLSIWDRVFGSYVGQPRGGHEGMAIGLDDFPGEAPTGIGWALAAPFTASRTGSKPAQ